VGVAWTGSENSYQAFVDKHGLTFPQINDDPGEVFSRFDVAFQPALVIVKADGSIETIAGAVDESLLDQILSESV
jgi:peroxiredoxin